MTFKKSPFGASSNADGYRTSDGKAKQMAAQRVAMKNLILLAQAAQPTARRSAAPAEEC